MTSRDDELLALFRAIASGDAVSLELTSTPIGTGATRADPETYFLAEIGHYVYAGDSALHIAAAAYRRGVAEELVARGADVSARNRRGAEPLHYAADGNPDAACWDPAAQADVVTYLLSVGADPNACDNSGVAPIHRAVRTRCSSAVDALIRGGADPQLRNKNGSTPLDLAERTTGRGGSGSDAARREQQRIIELLQ